MAGTIRIFAAAALAVGLVAVTVSGAETARVYDASGRYQGRIETRPDGQQRFYSSDGRYQGRAQPSGRQDGRERRIYGADGEYRGRTDGGPSTKQAGNLERK